LPQPEKTVRDKVVAEVRKLLVEVVGLQMEQELRVQRVHYLPVEPVVPAASMAEAEGAVATTEEAVAVLTPIVPATMLDPEAVVLLLLILSTRQILRTSPG
jgi:tetrahydromethanopterin S-methyltransferase subunit D